MLLDADSYKLTHWKQYPPNTTNIYSYFESRGGEFNETVFVGLQYYMKEYLEGKVVCQKELDELVEIAQEHFGSHQVNVTGWERIIDLHNGMLPLTIRALPEGTVTPVSVPLMTIENTDPEMFWLTNYVETLISELWYPVTVATQSRFMKKCLMKHLIKSGTPENIQSKLHDFGFRGVSSRESAGIGGAAHLVNFSGTDNLRSIKIVKDYYNNKCAGFSIPANEHSTVSSWGKGNEVDACRNMLKQYPTGPVSCVSDTWNIYNSCENIWGGVLKEEVMARDGITIIRPDSGNPIKVVPKCLEILGRKFGYTINNKGYKVLDPHVGMIQGDGVDRELVDPLLNAIESNGWSSDNITLGSGGALLQKLNRDTNRFAFKCSDTIRNGDHYPVYKSPVDAEFKRSKAGRFPGLPEVFRDGKILVEWTFDEIRERVNGYD